MAKPMPIGVDDFAEARKNYYFVDKTKFIRELWPNHAKVILMDLLAKYTGKSVVLLLDEYDAPIQSAWERGYYVQAIDFVRVMLTGALKTNRSLDFAVLTGILRIAKESIFSNLNNLQVSTLLNETYAEAMGFTEEEVRRIAVAYHAEDKLPEIRHWYDGYRFAGREIYNPWSSVNCMREGEVFCYAIA